MSLLSLYGYLNTDHKGTCRIDITYRSDYDLLDVNISYYENENTPSIKRETYKN